MRHVWLDKRRRPARSRVAAISPRGHGARPPFLDLNFDGTIGAGREPQPLFFQQPPENLLERRGAERREINPPHIELAEPVKDGDASRRVVRGGAWTSAPGYLRSAGRSSWDSAGLRDALGFRLARTLNH
jgi:hypothetical protein